MVSNILRSDSVSSRAAKLRRRLSLPVYSNKFLYANEQKQTFEFADNNLTREPIAEKTQPQSNDEVQLRQAVRQLDQQINQNEEETKAPAEPRPRPRPTREQKSTTTSVGARSERSSRRNSLVKVISDAMGAVRPYGDGVTTIQDDIHQEFNGMLYYNCEFSSPVRPASRVFEEASSARSRPKPNSSRYSWAGFDLAYRTQDPKQQDDLVAILEHDESKIHDNSAAIVAEPETISPSPTAAAAPQKKSPERTSSYEDGRRSGIIIDGPLADSIAASIHASTPPNEVPVDPMSAAESLGPAKRRSLIRRVSSSLFSMCTRFVGRGVYRRDL